VKRKRVDAGCFFVCTRRFLPEMHGIELASLGYLSSDRLRPLHRRKNALTPQRGIKASFSTSASLLPQHHSPKPIPASAISAAESLQDVSAELARASSEAMGVCRKLGAM
jgi:hypothetical protein